MSGYAVRGEKKKKIRKNRSHWDVSSFSSFRRSRPSLYNYATHVRSHVAGIRGTRDSEHDVKLAPHNACLLKNSVECDDVQFHLHLQLRWYFNRSTRNNLVLMKHMVLLYERLVKASTLIGRFHHQFTICFIDYRMEDKIVKQRQNNTICINLF